jgi:hypothetical protein
LDFRVKAEVVYSKTAYMPDRLMLIPVTEYVLVASSVWSSVQTFTLTYGTSSTTSSQATTFPSVTSDGNSQPQTFDQTHSPDFIYTHPPDGIFTNPLFMLVVGVALGVVVMVVVLVIFKRQPKTSTQTNIYAEPSPSEDKMGRKR